MATAIRPQTEWTVADLHRRFGPIAHGRVRQDPPPGTAVVADVVAIHDREDRLYELVDGILVEKTMGFPESYLAMLLGRLLGDHVERHRVGIVAGPDGTLQLAPGLVRIPDVSFTSWDRIPGRRLPSEPVPHLVPDLAVEILSPGNTRKEMDEKLDDYFGAGVRLVWFVDPRKRSVRVYTGRHESRTLREPQTLDGGEVLPGLEIPLGALFANVPEEPVPGPARPAKPKGRRRKNGSG